MATDAVSIRAATAPADFDAFGALLGDYLAWCRRRHADDPGLVDRVFGQQAFEQERASLAAVYGPPNGTTLLVVRGDDIGGGGAWRRLADGSGEMKRVFVADRLQGRGLGRLLCEALIADARAAGIGLLRIDTSDRFDEALGMYRSLGFRRCAPHRTYPADIMAHLVFMELPLDGRRRGD